MLAADPAIQQPVLPFWLQVLTSLLSAVGATAGLYLAYLKLVEIFQPAKLDIVLTKDSFLRLNFLGECVFCVATVLAKRAPVLIREVELSLQKVEGAKKRFELKVRHFGEILHGATLFAEHKFFGSSVLLHVADSKPLRIVYLCNFKDYIEGQIALVQEFEQAVLTLKNDLIAHHTAVGADEPAGDINRDVVRRIQINSELFAERMMALVQSEGGRYQLQMIVRFESLGNRPFGKRRVYEASSTLDFRMPAGARENLRTALIDTLRTHSENVILEKNVALTFPSANYLDPQER